MHSSFYSHCHDELMEPYFNYEEFRRQLHLSSQRQQYGYGLGAVQQSYWDDGSYGGYQEPPQWSDASYGGYYQFQPPPPSPYYEEQPWPFQQTDLQKEGSTKSIRELFIEQGYEWPPRREGNGEFARKPCQAVQEEREQISSLENQMEEKSEEEDVNIPSVGEVVEAMGCITSDEVVEQVEDQKEVSNNDPTPLPLLVEERATRLDHSFYIDPFELYMEDTFANNGMLVAIREQLGLEELTKHQDSVELGRQPKKLLLGQMHELVTPHGWLNLERVGVG